MIRFIDLTADYFCNNEVGNPPQWAFINTRNNRFLETRTGSHLFHIQDIDEHPSADRLRHLVSQKIILSEPLARAILDMEDIAFSEGQGPADGICTDTWDALVTAAEAIAGRVAYSTQARK